MKTRKFLSGLAVSGATLVGSTLSTSILAQETPATIPQSFFGTYEVAFASFNPDSPFVDGEISRLVLTSAGDFCLDDEELSDPVMRNGNMVEAIWSYMDAEVDIEFSLSNVMTEVINEVNVSGPDASPFYGQYALTKVSDSQDCAFASVDGDDEGSEEFAILEELGVTITDDEADVFYSAQSLFPKFFGSSPVFKYTSGFIYKFYKDSGIYIGLKDDSIYLLGGPFGKTPKKQGTVSSLLSYFDVVRQKQNIEHSDTDIPDISGDWDLTLSGVFGVTVAGITVDTDIPTITLTDVPAPNPDDLDQISETIESTLEGVSEVQDVIIEIINNTESRITFNLEFSATPATGGEATYTIEYDYVK